MKLDTFLEERPMKRNFGSRSAALIGLITIVFVAVGAASQLQLSALMGSMAANADQLRQYTFKQRIETHYKGELKGARVDEIHYSVDGERVSITLDEQKAQSEPRRRGPGSRFVAKRIEKKQEEMQEYSQRLMALGGRYLAGDPAKLQAALVKAEVTPDPGSKQVRITLRNYIQSGDRMTMSFDSATNRPTTTEISTTLGDDPVSVVVTFDKLREGPSYAGRTVAKSTAKHLEVRVFTYDYRR